MGIDTMMQYLRVGCISPHLSLVLQLLDPSKDILKYPWDQAPQLQ